MYIWDNFKNQNKQVQSTLRQAYWNHIEHNILDSDEENFGETQKKFWRRIKAQKRDRTGTAPLKEHGLLVSEAKGKAGILNRQYQSAFSQEDPNNIPAPEETEAPKMHKISVTEEGVLKLLSNLQEAKASGPDLIPSKVLKAAAKSSLQKPSTPLQ
jgi:hypothetical protein